MVDRGEAPGPSRQDKGKAMVGEPSAEINEPGPVSGNTLMVRTDEKEHAYYNPPRSVPRSLAKKDMFLSIALTSQQVDEAYPKLNLSATEAFLLTNRLEILEVPPGRFSENLAMTDMLGNRYSMTISNHNSGSPSRFLVNTEWGRFVHLNKLKEGDELEFYRLLDHVSGQACYVLRPVKNLENLEPSRNTLMVRADEKEHAFYNLPRQFPRSLAKKDTFLSIALTSQQVDEAYPKLNLSAIEAFLLTNRLEILEDPPGWFSENLDMTDMFDNCMTISNHNSVSPSQFLVNTEWTRFVHLNMLKEGDELEFYRLLDPVTSFVYDNQSRRLLPSLETSVAPPGFMAPSLEGNQSVLLKILTSQDTDPINSVLYIDASEAYTLTDCVNLLKPTSVPNPMMLSAFYEGDQAYNLRLSYCSINKYSISQDWGLHKLKASIDPVYEPRYVRREEPEMAQPLNLLDLKRMSSPNSRDIKVPLFKLTNTVSAHQGNILKICFDGNEAWMLTSCSQLLEDCPCGTLLMNLLVYDESNNPYDMVLTRLKSDDGEVVCTFDVGWHRFVDTHSLKAGDKVTICSIHGEKYYTIEYTRADLPSGSVASGLGPGGSGQ